MMMNKETSVATGSAFVQFKTSLAVQKCLRTAESEGGVVCNGQQLNISVALPRDKIKREGLEKEDKRNLYLAKEGGMYNVIMELLNVELLPDFGHITIEGCAEVVPWSADSL